MMGSSVVVMGLDSSTQGLKCTLLNDALETVYERAINFDRDLPGYGTEGGVHIGADGLRVTSPPLMWVAALDLLLSQMQSDGVDFSSIVAISGSGQQHGSVWLKAGAASRLSELDASAPLESQLGGIFSVEASPVWMDSSTGKQCAAREAALGGAQAVATLTGSRAYERFTGNQIAKIYEEQPDAYLATERICLVSSFMASLLIGGYAAIDVSDGSGMNLMDIRTRDWSPSALDCTGPGLRERLGGLVASHERVGGLSDYFVKRYGFASGVSVIAFSGDNPNSLAGLGMQDAGDIAVSLGTSDTVFGFLAEAKPSATEGHIFVNPVDPDAFMALVCYKNGSLTREAVRDAVAGGRWETFHALVAEMPAGNEGQIGFYIRDAEITPPIQKTGFVRFDADGQRVEAFGAAADCRAVCESHFMSMRLHGENVGFEPRRILATGGASVERGLLQIMSDVFGAPVYVASQSDSASLGAAYRALHGWRCEQGGGFVGFGEILSQVKPLELAVEPNAEAHAVYSSMMDRYARLEQQLIDE